MNTRFVFAAAAAFAMLSGMPGAFAAGNFNGVPANNVNQNDLRNDAPSLGAGFNPQHGSVIVVLWCNAVAIDRTVEALVGPNPSPQQIVASMSGTGRGSLTFVVPWNWYWHVTAVRSQNGDPVVNGSVCKATAWTAY